MLAMPFALLLGIAHDPTTATSAISPDPLTHWLQNTYGNAASATAPWPDKLRTPDGKSQPVSRAVCAAKYSEGIHFIAVCSRLITASHAEPGRVDLFVVSDGRGAWSVSAERRDIGTGSSGTPGAVQLLLLAPGEMAFRLESTYSMGGWSTQLTTLYARDTAGKGLDPVLSIDTRLENSGAYDGSAAVAVTCTLQTQHTAPHGRRPALALHAKGQRDGHLVDHRFTLPFDGRSWTLPLKADLVTKGCAGS